MAWVRVDDSFYDHPKFHDAGPLGLAVWITGLAYCNRNMTDGVIPETVLHRLVDFTGLAYTTATIGGSDGRPLAAMEETNCAPFAIWSLIDAGLLHDDGHDCEACPQPGRRRLIYHDYRKYQPTREEIRERHEQKAGAGRKGAEARWGKADDKAPAIADAKADEMAPAIADGWQSDGPTPTPTPSSKTPAPAKLADLDNDPDFTAFWDAYPKKVGKGQARRAWSSMLKKGADPDEVVAAVEAFAKSCADAGTDPKFIPHPSTWLNGERWSDEMSPEPDEAPRIRDVAEPAPPGLDAAQYAAWYAEQQRSQR